MLACIEVTDVMTEQQPLSSRVERTPSKFLTPDKTWMGRILKFLCDTNRHPPYLKYTSLIRRNLLRMDRLPRRQVWLLKKIKLNDIKFCMLAYDFAIYVLGRPSEHVWPTKTALSPGESETIEWLVDTSDGYMMGHEMNGYQLIRHACRRNDASCRLIWKVGQYSCYLHTKDREPSAYPATWKWLAFSGKYRNSRVKIQGTMLVRTYTRLGNNDFGLD